MKSTLLILSLMAFAVLFLSCSVPGSSAMGEIKGGMSKAEVHSIMQSHGLKPENSRKRPSGGWETHGHDPFAAGSMANNFERENGTRIESAEVYQVTGRRGTSVIDLYYDSAGKLVR